MTSMIDVTFLLLIFFICASRGSLREQLMNTRLSDAGAVNAPAVAKPVEKPLPVDEIRLTLQAGATGGVVTLLNGTPYDSFGELSGVLRELGDVARENPVVLEIEPDVTTGDVVRVYDVCREARFTTIQFAGPKRLRH